MSGAASLALLAAGLVLVVVGAELLLGGLLGAARRLGTTPFVLTAVLSGLELENIAAGIAANARGLPNAAAGTFLGGTTFLALAVAGAGALVRPLDAGLLPRRALVWTAAAPLPLLLLALDGELTGLDAVFLLAWFVLALVGLARSDPALLAADTEPTPRRSALRLVTGLALLGAGGELLADGIKRTVANVGLSQTLLGNTVVAASVEAEEVARVAAPARRGRSDVALANVLGTVVHFAALNAGVIALVRPLELDDETRFLHLPTALAATLVLCAVLATRRRLGRPQAALLLTLYAADLATTISVAAA